ncbi:RNA-directed DNA polymerase, eukaryota [Tanacetum coccineum]
MVVEVLLITTTLCLRVLLGLTLLESYMLFLTKRRSPRGGVEEEKQLHLLSCTTDLLLPHMLDRLVWSLEASGDFLVKSVHNLIDNMLLQKRRCLPRWVDVIPNKINVLAWRLCFDKLFMRLNLSLRGLEIPSILCPLCSISVESTSHFFSRVLWHVK